MTRRPTVQAICQGPMLFDLIDSLVAAVDLDRVAEIERLREALEPFDAVGLFNNELQLDGVRSADLDSKCFCEAWL